MSASKLLADPARRRALVIIREVRRAQAATNRERRRRDAEFPGKVTNWFCAECGLDSDLGPMPAHHPSLCGPLGAN